MMREALRFIASPVRGLQAAVYVLAASALLSSILALVRDRLFAHTFGAGVELDLYYAAFRIPDLIFVGTGALVSVYMLIPELARRTGDQQKEYIDTMVVGFSALAIVASGLTALFTPFLLGLLFPKLAAAGLLPTLIALTRIMLLQPILLGLSNILAAITQARNRYALYSLSPILYNLGIIAGLIFLYPYLGIVGLAWGVVLGAILHVGIQIPSVLGDGFFRAVPMFREGKAFVETISISIPRALALSMNQVTVLGLTILASGLSSGSIAVFTFAYNLMSVPLSIVGASYSVAAFPTLASALASGRRGEFIEHVAMAARYILFWSLPIIGIIIVLRAHIVRVVLGSGAFDWTDTRLTAAAFALLTLALAGNALTLLLTRAYYAAGRTLVPFFIATVSAVATVLAAALFIQWLLYPSVSNFVQELMRLQGVPGTAILAIAGAHALVSIVMAFVLAISFERKFGGLLARIRSALVDGILASLGGALAAYAVLSAVGPLTLSSTLLSVFIRGSFGGIAGIVAVGIVYALLGNREFQETVLSIRSRLWRELPSKPIRSAEEIGSSSPQ